VRKAALLITVVLTGCINSHGIRPLRPLELATAPYLGRIVDARSGSLMYEGGCLLFREDRTAAQFLPIWPDGSIFNGTSVIFHQPAKTEQRIIVGEEFVLEGQSVPWPALAASGYMPFRHQCGRQPFFVSSVRPAD
jgi:hypothetical protein